MVLETGEGLPREKRVALSVVLPAYNEAKRLPPFLESVGQYCRRQFEDDYEIVIADDGSSDGLEAVLTRQWPDWPQLKYVRLAENRGKGAAVRAGILAAQGELLLFADADGATPISEADRLRSAIEQGADFAVGSRLLPGAGVRRDRKWPRGLMGRGFALVARFLLRLPVRDTQCGFKMFRHDAGQRLFGELQEEGFLFDLELLMRAESQGYRVVEVPVNWSEKSGSRFHWLNEFWKIAAGLRRLRQHRIALHNRTGGNR